MNWEAVFERDLIPMVAAARSETALEQAVGVVISALFRRADDAVNRDQFFALLQVSLARNTDFSGKVDSAIGFLRLVKSTRQTLAEQAAGKRPEAASGISTDMENLSRVVTAPAEGAPLPPARLRPATVAATPEPAKPAAPSGFVAVFDHVVCAYLRDVCALLQVARPGSLRLPCLAHPAFAEALEQVVRAHVLPDMRSSRAIKALGDSHVWEEGEGGPKAVRGFLGANEYNNPIIYTWDKRWSEFGPRTVNGRKVFSEDARKVWSLFQRHAESNGYVSPTARDIALFLTLPRYDLARLRAAWREIGHLYEQEFAPRKHQDLARDGALRDALLKWEGREGLPAHAIEWLAIRASTSFPRLDLDWLTRFATNKGKTMEERVRAVPYVMQVVGG